MKIPPLVRIPLKAGLLSLITLPIWQIFYFVLIYLLRDSHVLKNDLLSSITYISFRYLLVAFPFFILFILRKKLRGFGNNLERLIFNSKLYVVTYLATFIFVSGMISLISKIELGLVMIMSGAVMLLSILFFDLRLTLFWILSVMLIMITYEFLTKQNTKVNFKRELLEVLVKSVIGIIVFFLIYFVIMIAFYTTFSDGKSSL